MGKELDNTFTDAVAEPQAFETVTVFIPGNETLMVEVAAPVFQK